MGNLKLNMIYTQNMSLYLHYILESLIIRNYRLRILYERFFLNVLYACARLCAFAAIKSTFRYEYFMFFEECAH